MRSGSIFVGVRALDRKLAMLKIEEQLLGFYDGTEEYRPPLDTQA